MTYHNSVTSTYTLGSRSECGQAAGSASPFGESESLHSFLSRFLALSPFPNSSYSKLIFIFFSSLGLEHLTELLQREQITLDILGEMSHEDLKQAGVTAYGHRHRLIKGVQMKLSTPGKQKLSTVLNLLIIHKWRY